MCRTATVYSKQLITYMWDRHEVVVKTSEMLRDAWMCVEVVVAASFTT